MAVTDKVAAFAPELSRAGLKATTTRQVRLGPSEAAQVLVEMANSLALAPISDATNPTVVPAATEPVFVTVKVVATLVEPPVIVAGKM